MNKIVEKAELILMKITGFMRKTAVRAGAGAEKLVSEEKGEAYVGEAIKILIAVVIGALLLTLTYTLMKDTVFATVTAKVKSETADGQGAEASVTLRWSDEVRVPPRSENGRLSTISCSIEMPSGSPSVNFEMSSATNTLFTLSVMNMESLVTSSLPISMPSIGRSDMKIDLPRTIFTCTLLPS